MKMFKYRCMQPFDAEGPGELTIKRDDILIATNNSPSDGWLQVKSLNGGQGFVPHAYLEFLTMTEVDASGGGTQQPQEPYQQQQQPMYQQQQQQQANPFDTMGQMQASLPNEQQQPVGGALEIPPGQQAQAQAGNRTSYVAGKLGRSASQKDQYKVTNPTQFQETLELWRERERRFMKGEPERLPQPKKREYFYWDRNGVRHGPMSEEQMRAMFDNRQLSADTPIALQTEKGAIEAVELQDYFPEINSAFQTVPVVTQANETMWLYLDDVGQTQGPFTSSQMREWFQDGYFNAETLVRLANSGPNDFVQLGLLFPEGEGAFLSEGDQEGAKQKQAVLDNTISSPSPGAGDAMAGAAGFGAGMMTMGAANMGPYDTMGTANPFDTMAAPTQYDYGAGYDQFSAMPEPAPVWGGPEPAYIPPPEPPTFNPYGGGDFDPYAYPPAGLEADDGGKALFMKALSGNETDPLGMPPPAIGGAAGAPPSALKPAEEDDWGITWDDEPEWSPATGQEPEAHAMPITVAHTDEDDDNLEVTQFSELQNKYLCTVDALYVFLTRSLPKHLGTVRCKIKRSVVGLHVNYNLYELYLEQDDGRLGPQILIAQKHRKYAVDSYYNIAIGSVNKKEAGKVISSLVFNTLGTNFVAHNNVAAHKGKPRDLAVIVYQRNMGKGPRKFQVALPALKDGSETEQIEWPHQGSVKRSKMLQALVSLDFPRLQPLVNKKPTWSKKHKAWVLNFHGRVTRSSVKNFQLVRPDEDKTVVLQFGRVGPDTFTMDLRHPVSPVAAFCICVSSLHSKLAVD
mmetsp:Transcript_20732/g.34233  ORF Transcript_20732/g.34233 Transcript_20732/m.34233 type:complete len:796 (-) Transcript_20732:37-2424(-)